MLLRKTKNVFMIYEGDELEVYGYSYTSFQLYIDEKKILVKICFFILNGGAMS
jgi:hypothetical protein